MTALRRAIAELIGLFIDDTRLALFEVALIAGVALAVKLGTIPPLSGGGLLLFGCLAILAESVFRTARR
jgi:hypothetical protein